MDAKGKDGGAGNSRQVEQDAIDDEDVWIFDDLVGDLDDGGGEGEEGVPYLALPDPPPPTRAAWLRHCLAEAVERLAQASKRRAPPWPDPSERVPERAWSRLADSALKPAPKWMCGEAQRAPTRATSQSRPGDAESE
jgi:hypothetical protein